MVQIPRNNRRKSTDLQYFEVPKNWVSAPLFPPLPQTEPYSVEFGYDPNSRIPKYRWTTGCDIPLEYRRPHEKSPYLRGFDTRHSDLIYLFMTEYQAKRIPASGEYIIGYNKLLEKIGKTTGPKERKYISLLLDDLYNINVFLEDLSTGKGYIFRPIKTLETKMVGKERTLANLCLDERLISFLNTIEDFLHFRFDVKASMSSTVAQAMYTYLPSRAVSHKEDNPWKIRLENLMAELKIPMEKYKGKARRKQFFTQNKKSILSQLDGAPIATGDLLRVKLEPTKDDTDYNLCLWTEAYTQKPRDSKVLTWWLDAGRDPKEYAELVRNKRQISCSTYEHLQCMGFDPAKDKNYFELCQALYPHDFDEYISMLYARWLNWQIRNVFAVFRTEMQDSFFRNGARTLPLETEEDK